MVMAVDAPDVAWKLRLRPPQGMRVGFGSLPLPPRRHMASILATAQRFSLPDDWRLRLAESLAVGPLDAPMGRRPCRRVVVGHVALECCPPLPALRFMLLQKCVNTGRLLL